VLGRVVAGVQRRVPRHRQGGHAEAVVGTIMLKAENTSAYGGVTELAMGRLRSHSGGEQRSEAGEEEEDSAAGDLKNEDKGDHGGAFLDALP